MDRSLPQARKDELLVHALNDETLVYDLKRHRAHTLNRAAALVWRHCDGMRTIAEMAALLQQALALPAEPDIVWMVLERLGKAHLLQEQPIQPPDVLRPSRRELVRKLHLAGKFAILVSLVESITIPAAFAGSCVPEHGPCSDSSQCCDNKECVLDQGMMLCGGG